jgi:hypothetical protein
MQHKQLTHPSSTSCHLVCVSRELLILSSCLVLSQVMCVGLPPCVLATCVDTTLTFCMRNHANCVLQRTPPAASTTFTLWHLRRTQSLTSSLWTQQQLSPSQLLRAPAHTGHTEKGAPECTTLLLLRATPTMLPPSLTSSTGSGP